MKKILFVRVGKLNYFTCYDAALISLNLRVRARRLRRLSGVDSCWLRGGSVSAWRRRWGFKFFVSRKLMHCYVEIIRQKLNMPSKILI
jgi:hypothetical protein